MVPLYQQLSEKIKQQIADGKLKAGDDRGRIQPAF